MTSGTFATPSSVLAIVAALGGIRFQSECQHLAERSGVMRVMLRGRTPRPFEDAPQPIEKESAIKIGAKDFSALKAAGDDVVQGTGTIEAGLSRAHLPPVAARCLTTK